VQPLLNLDDVSELLNVRRARIYELVESKNPALRLPCVRLGTQLRFRPEDVERYVDAHSAREFLERQGTPLSIENDSVLDRAAAVLRERGGGSSLPGEV
jgi:excisionase family DNA binding protein